MRRYDGCVILFSFFIFNFSQLSATVAPIVVGQSLWWIVKRIGLSVDSFESKVDLIYPTTTDAVNVYANVYITA